MCGFYVSIGLDFDNVRLDRIIHRGPDGVGVFQTETNIGKLVMGHRRLAVIDTDIRSNQPMIDNETKSSLILNGEIYNFREIREKLEQKKISFVTTSDSETLLKALDFWGVECLDMLRGMFAFVYYDNKNQKLFIVRDPYGIKPIYYKKVKNGIAFSSEPKQIFDLGENSKLNKSIAADYLLHNVTDHSEQTFFSDIYQLRGGFKIEIDLNKEADLSSLNISRWYSIPKKQPKTYNFAKAKDKFRKLFDNEILLHRESDVPIGSCLSGGLDSSAIVGALVTQAGDDFETFSAVFPGEQIDESKFINSVIRKFGTLSNKIEIDLNKLEDSLEKVIWHQDEPFGSCSILLQNLVFKKVHERNIKVVLDGQGADEQLAGYHGLFDFALINYLRNGRLFSLAKLIYERKILHETKISSQICVLVDAIFGKCFRKAKALDYLEGARLSNHIPNENLISRSMQLNGIKNINDIGDQCFLLALVTSLPMLLRFEDRNSMAYSVEARVPFVGRDLIEFSLSLADNFKLDGARTKVILREALKDYLPDDVYSRNDKIGFAPPEEMWLRGPLNKKFKSGIELFFIRFPNLLNEAVILSKYNCFIGGGKYDSILWRVANIGLWAEKFNIKE